MIDQQSYMACYLENLISQRRSDGFPNKQKIPCLNASCMNYFYAIQINISNFTWDL